MGVLMNRKGTEAGASSLHVDKTIDERQAFWHDWPICQNRVRSLSRQQADEREQWPLRSDGANSGFVGLAQKDDFEQRSCGLKGRFYQPRVKPTTSAQPWVLANPSRGPEGAIPRDLPTNRECPLQGQNVSLVSTPRASSALLTSPSVDRNGPSGRNSLQIKHATQLSSHHIRYPQVSNPPVA